MSFQNELNEDHIKKISSNEFKETLETESENNQIKRKHHFENNYSQQHALLIVRSFSFSENPTNFPNA